MFFPLRFRPKATPAVVDTTRVNTVGTPLVLEGRIRDRLGRGLRGATVAVRHSDAAGAPRGDSRPAAVCSTDDNGHFVVTTVQPAPYQIPTDAVTGWFMAQEGWSPWRPAHLHVTVRAPGMRTVTARLYFRRDSWIRHDAPCGSILDPRPMADGVDRAVHDVVLERAVQRTSTYSA